MRLMEVVGKREGEVGQGAVALGWVKSHIGIYGNEMAVGDGKGRGDKKGGCAPSYGGEASGKRSRGGGKMPDK